MELTKFLRDNIEEGERDGLRRSLLEDNVRKGGTLAWVVIAFEVCFAAMDAGAAILKVDSRFHFSLYLGMYLAMIAMNVVYLLLARRARDLSGLDARAVGRRAGLLTAYVTLMMCWGSVISLMDQRLYGQIIVFMVNMITCSVIFCLDNRQVVLPYACSTAILLVGLPFFQSSSDVLIGHYLNLAFFTFISWTASRIAYARYCSDYRSRLLLVQANEQLGHEIELNKAVNLLLADANRQLRNQSLVDELTGLANRRGFRNYIDAMFSDRAQEDMAFTVLLIDVDFFKEYNDHYGHVAADRALAEIAEAISSAMTHKNDIAVRWGGEEFVYAAFGLEDAEAVKIAESIREKVFALQIRHEYSQAENVVTVSAGCCTMDIRGRGDVSRCVDRADKAMYRAKAAGRNRTEQAV